MSKTKRLPTLADVAKRAGVSKSAAGFALNHSTRISLPTRERVERAARDLGYRPNLAATLLGRHKREAVAQRVSPAIALLLHDPSYPKHEPGNWSYRSIETIQATATELGFVCSVHDMSGFVPRDLPAFFASLRSRGVGGLLLYENEQLSPLLGNLRDVPFPVAAVDMVPGRPDPNITRTCPDFFNLVVQAWEKAFSRGYHRPGFAVFQHQVPTYDDRVLASAAHSCLRALSPTQRTRLFCGRHDDFPGFGKWYQTNHPDVVISLHAGPYWWLQDLGIRLPQEAGLVCLQCSSLKGPNRSISGFVLDNHRIAERALKGLADMMDRGERGLEMGREWTLVGSAWQEGSTLPERRRPGGPKRKGRGFKSRSGVSPGTP